MNDTWNHDVVGTTASGTAPPGYRTLDLRRRLGTGDEADLARLGGHLLALRVHAGTGAVVGASTLPVQEGTLVTTRLGTGPLSVAAPCRVVRTASGPGRVGFAYGTLPGHPVAGEESFAVERDPDGTIALAVRAVSRPAHPLVRLAGPAVPLAQLLYVELLARSARRLLRR